MKVSDGVERFRQRYSCALLADAAYRIQASVGVAPAALSPLDPDTMLAGPVVTVRANNDLVGILGAVHRAKVGEVVVIGNDLVEAGLMGDLIATEALRKGLGGIVVDGLVRDSTPVIEMGLPVFCRGTVPVGPLKLPRGLKGVAEIGAGLTLGDAKVMPGDWAFGDSDGVIFLAAKSLDRVFEQADDSLERERRILEEMQSGSALGDLLEIESFLEERARNPEADFNRHLKSLGRAI